MADRGKVDLAALEWLARLVEEIGWSCDASEGETYYREACALLGQAPRELHISEPSEDAANLVRIRAALDGLFGPPKPDAPKEGT